jgi:hypothetical protein
VTSIEQAGLAWCTNLTSVIIPNSISVLDFNVFHGCTSLPSIELPISISAISAGAFYNCSSLSAISCFRQTAPMAYVDAFGHNNEDATYTGRNTYSTGTNVICILYNSTGYDSGEWLDPLQNATKCGFHIKYMTSPENTLVIYKNGSISSYEITGELGYNSIQNPLDAKIVEVGTAVTRIGACMFSGLNGDNPNNNLKSVSIPYTVTSFGEQLFGFCKQLSSINIPSGLSIIPKHAFVDCVSLSSIEIPSSVTSIYPGAFKYCVNLTSITCLADVAPSAYGAAFGEGDPDGETYTGHYTCSSGTNKLYVPYRSTGYDSNQWADPLQITSKCGFSIEYFNPTIVTYLNGTTQNYFISGELT